MTGCLPTSFWSYPNLPKSHIGKKSKNTPKMYIFIIFPIPPGMDGWMDGWIFCGTPPKKHLLERRLVVQPCGAWASL